MPPAAVSPPLRIHQITGRMLTYGGPSYTVPALAAACAAHDDVTLHALAPFPDMELPGVRIAAHPVIPRLARIEASPAMRDSLRKAALEGADILHTHGLWTLPTIYPTRAARGTGCRVLVSPRGTLDPWAIRHHKWRKRLWWHSLQSRALRGAHCLHATAPMEYDAFRAMGLANPIAVVPNGQHLPTIEERPQTGSPRRVLFLARLHPKKGVVILLHAWSRVQARFPDTELHIVGPDDDNRLPEFTALARELGVERCAFHGEVSEAEKDRHFRSADLYVLPTHGENWGVSVAEALGYGVPAIVSRAAPWSGLETHRCGWWIHNNEEDLASSIEEALSLPPAELRARGARGRQWVEREFGWDRVGEMMRETYLWLARGTARPDWVHD